VKYKIGDKVRIKPLKWFVWNKINIDKQQLKFCDQTGKIFDIWFEAWYFIDIDNNRFVWKENFLIGIKEERLQKIKKLSENEN